MKVNLILDSGAFSAWIKQTEIRLEDYIAFCLERLDYASYIVSLDVIPGKFGKKHLSKQEIDESAEKGWNNYLRMIEAGIPKEKLIHVFHQGEDFSWLEKTVNNMDYIGLSPANDRTTPEKIAWLDECMQYVCDEEGLPKVKFHGFAVTSHRLMARYCWYSVDSTSWVLTGRLGSIYVPKFNIKTQKYNFLAEPYKIVVSGKSPKNKEEGEHFGTLPGSMQKYIREYLLSSG